MLYGDLGEVLHKRTQTKEVARWAKSDHTPHRKIRHQTALSKFFSCMDIGEMHLDKGDVYGQKSISKRD